MSSVNASFRVLAHKLVISLAAEKNADSPFESDMKMGPQKQLGAESQSEGTI